MVAKAKTSLVIRPDEVTLVGSAWGAELPGLRIKQYENGDVTRQITIPLRAVDVCDIVEKLWKIQKGYAETANMVERYLINQP